MPNENLPRRSFLGWLVLGLTAGSTFWRGPASHAISIQGTEIVPGWIGKYTTYSFPFEDWDPIEYNKAFPPGKTFPVPNDGEPILQTLQACCGPWFRRLKISKADYEKLLQQLTLLPTRRGAQKRNGET